MKRKLFIIILFGLIFNFAFCTSSFAQNVYDGPDVNLFCQNDINTFGASNYTDINASLQISYFNDLDPIEDLTPLSSITSISGTLFIFNHSKLTNLNGLNSLTYVGGDLIISNNGTLTSIAELGNITSVGGNITITNNTLLLNLAGLENITSIGGNFNIQYDDALTNLFTLSSLTSINGTVNITYNPVLADLDGLESLTSVGMNLSIYSNAMLTNLDGLKNLGTVGGTAIEIYSNGSLVSFCGLYNLFSSGTYPPNEWPSYVTIYDNLANPTIADIIAAGPCPSPGVYTGDIIINNQSLVAFWGDFLATNGYTAITGDLSIGYGADIADLTPLQTLSSIGGSLSILSNDVLTNLHGLDSLTSVGGSIVIGYNPLLTDIGGLQNLSSVGTNIQIYGNSALPNLDGLEKITSFSGFLSVVNNPLLANLDGLINLTNVGDAIEVTNNTSLISFCGLYPLFSSGTHGTVTISENGINTTVEDIINAGPCIKIYIGNLDLHFQSQVNSIGAILSDGGYVGISGHLLIENSSDIVDLTPLSSITTIGGYVDINGNDKLQNLVGLENLRSVGEYVSIARNFKLISLNGLDSLATISGSLKIEENFVLATLDGLGSLSSVGGDLSIKVIKTLPNLSGLQNLTSVGGNLNIIGWITSIAELGNLTSVGGNFDINNNGAISNLDGPSNLTSIGGNLNIGITKLTNLDGLSKLSSVGGDINIQSNPDLASFCGLYNLFTLGSYGNVTISDNGENPTVDEIIALGPCTPEVTLVYVDIYPGTCPNLLNVRARGFIPAAILGTADFDIQNIDPETLLLEGVSPDRWSIKDVATPVSSGEQCDCTIEGPDGYLDLNLKFDAQELVAALGEVNDGDEIILTMTGETTDGIPIEGSDCVVILAKNLGKELSDNLNNIPDEYALFENYPNPFNPSTKIQFAIPLDAAGITTLKVYNLLGKETATLVNEIKEPGIYEVEFNAADLPSGIYFYKLTSGNFSETKKMMLLK